MRTVVLPGTALTPSRLAFGSALMMVRLGRRQSVRLLEVAHDSGITHFDTARAYGYGEAESALGEFLSRRREGVTVATKLGIAPPRPSHRLRAAKALARAVAKRAPVLRPVFRRGGQSMVQTGRFSPAEARRSLETSLRELGVETIDILLLHECRPRDLETEGLLEFFDSVVREGKVRHFGIGTDLESTRVIVEERPEFAQVAQFAHSAVDPALERLTPLGDTAVITHSAVREPLTRLTELMCDERRCRRWSHELGLDCGRPDVLGRLLLAYALESNADGVVLFGSADEGRIRSNAALADGDEFSREQIRHFGRLVRDAAGQGR